jgi:iron complex transport system ATP-binding protein
MRHDRPVAGERIYLAHQCSDFRIWCATGDMAGGKKKKFQQNIRQMTAPGKNMVIELEKLSVGYRKRNNDHCILKDLNASLFHGELVCLVGENGIGKSTLLRSISGVQPPLSGEILINNKRLQEFTTLELAKTISLVLTDRIYAGNLSVREIVSLGRHPYTNWLGHLSKEDHLKIDWALEITGTLYLEDQLISELSDGQYQKTLIARALAQDSDIIILDEPTAHLDLTNKITILKLLKDLAANTGKSILMATHELELSLQIADYIWMALNRDEMVTGTPEDLVFNGSFNKMISHETIHFDDAHGRFIIKNKANKFCQLIGEKAARYLTKNALQRKGWTVTNREDTDISIEIKKETSSLTWLVNCKDRKVTVSSIEQLLGLLNKM